MQCVCDCLCLPSRDCSHISLGGEGNALYPVLLSYLGYFINICGGGGGGGGGDDDDDRDIIKQQFKLPGRGRRFSSSQFHRLEVVASVDIAASAGG